MASRLRRRHVAPFGAGLLAVSLASGVRVHADEPAAVDVVALAAEVRATEAAFAATMAARDHGAFTRFLAVDTVFMGDRKALRGRAAVAAAWTPYFAAEEAPFAWAPETVEVLADGSLGFSSGPIYGPDGARIGTFNSVWRHTADGSWQIVFDKGCPRCAAAAAP